MNMLNFNFYIHYLIILQKAALIKVLLFSKFYVLISAYWSLEKKFRPVP